MAPGLDAGCRRAGFDYCLLGRRLKGYAEPPTPVRDPQIGQSFQVPYRLTDTNHFLVRYGSTAKAHLIFSSTRVAPALFIATETAKKIGLKVRPRRNSGRPIDQLDLEGGSRPYGRKGQG